MKDQASATASQVRAGDVVHCGQPVNLGDPDYATHHQNLRMKPGDTPRVDVLCRVCGETFEVVVVGSPMAH